MVVEKPYVENIISLNEKIRIFYPNSKEEELKWHWDEKDREVLILEGGGWKFQRENSLPESLIAGKNIFISAGEWHRVISGKDILRVKIQEK